jgi:hypothetical protein
MDDAGELAAGLAQLGFGFAREACVRPAAIDDEDAPDQSAPELLADAIDLVERLQRLGDGPEVERARLDR